MIEVRELTKEFNDVKAVNSVSFNIQKGEVVGLIGENGAGKTTLLRLLSTVLTPTDGNANINGNSIVNSPNKVRDDIGILFGGETGLYDRLTTKENLEYFGLLNGIDKNEIMNRIKYLSKFFQMEEYLNRRTGKLSKGMKQKVAIARSIIHSPEVILLDEPTSGLDVSVTKIVHDFIKDLSRKGNTVIFSSHNMDEVKRLCEKIIIINKGKIIFDGYIKEFETKSGLSLNEGFIELVSKGDELYV